MSDVTRILSAIDAGDPHAAEQLLPLVYDELRKLATRLIGQEKPGQTLQATALVHEAYVRLVASNGEARFDGRPHFFAAAAEAMRRILVEQARRKGAEKHGGRLVRQELCEIAVDAPESDADLLAVDEALTRFEAISPTKAAIVKLRYFAGLTIPQAAEALGISSTTADRQWAYARAWLHAELTRSRRD